MNDAPLIIHHITLFEQTDDVKLGTKDKLRHKANSLGALLQRVRNCAGKKFHHLKTSKGDKTQQQQIQPLFISQWGKTKLW